METGFETADWSRSMAETVKEVICTPLPHQHWKRTRMLVLVAQDTPLMPAGGCQQHVLTAITQPPLISHSEPNAMAGSADPRCACQADRSLLMSLVYTIGFMAVLGIAVYVSYKQGHAVLSWPLSMPLCPTPSLAATQHASPPSLQVASCAPVSPPFPHALSPGRQ